MKQIVAIDGPSGAGKSTLSRTLARSLNYLHLDTGAMYRAVALAAIGAGVTLNDPAGLDKLCSVIDIKLKDEPDGLVVMLDGVDVTEQIRTPEISIASSNVSAVSEVRRHMVRLQREMGAQGGVIAEGRDVGTVVFPGTRAKFYIDASLWERARRRHEELKEKGADDTLEQVMAEIEQRDKNDSARSDSPLRIADDAIIVDTTYMTPEEVVKYIAEKVRELEKD